MYGLEAAQQLLAELKAQYERLPAGAQLAITANLRGAKRRADHSIGVRHEWPERCTEQIAEVQCG